MLIDLRGEKCYSFSIKGGGFMNIGEKIYKLRTEKNLSQGDLAEIVEVSRQSVSKWENGAAVPDLDKIIRLAEVFGITVDELVKGESLPSAKISKVETEKEKSVFPPRKIAGTVLLSLSLIVTVIFLAAGGGFLGLFLSIPLILCGIICFIFRKNVGLWCGWASVFAADIFLRFAMGISMHAVRYTLIWNYDMNYTRLAVAWAQLIVLLAMIIITVLKLRRNPLESKKPVLIFWAAFAFLKLGFFVFSKSGLYSFILSDIASYAAAYDICYTLFDWLCLAVFTAALVFTARYFTKS